MTDEEKAELERLKKLEAAEPPKKRGRPKGSYNKFDPKPEPEVFEPEQCTDPCDELPEKFLVFLRRAFGTSKVAPAMMGGEAINGATVKALSDFFIAAYGLKYKPATGPGAEPSDPLAERRRMLEANGASQ